MRLKERQLKVVKIAARECVKGALGSIREGYSAEKTAVRASVLPESDGFSVRENGLKSGKALRLIIPADVCVSEGDGVWVDGVCFTVSSVQRWRAHAELACVKTQ